MHHSTRSAGHHPVLNGAWPLMLLYLAIFLIPPGSVPHLHHDHDLHSEDTCTHDACHIAIYHPGSHGACDHKNHLTKAEQECQVCHVICPRYIATETDVLYVAVPAKRMPAFRYITSSSIPSFIFHADRGPPSLI